MLPISLIAFKTGVIWLRQASKASSAGAAFELGKYFRQGRARIRDFSGKLILIANSIPQSHEESSRISGGQTFQPGCFVTHPDDWRELLEPLLPESP
jgi:hypothetical protein